MTVRSKHKKTTAMPSERPTRESAHPVKTLQRVPGRLSSKLRTALAASPWYLGAVALTYAMTLPLFAPWSVWPLGYVAFVPWLILVCWAGSAAGVYLASYVLGAAFFFTHWRWLFDTTPPGYFAGCIAFALYFCLAAWLVRHLAGRRRIPVTFAFPVAWILVEMMRSRGPLAFPWFLIGHSQIRLLSFVQLADITGVYGISFAVAMVNGLIVDLFVRRQRRAGVEAQESAAGGDNRVLWWPAAPIAVVFVIATVFGYGWWRLAALPVESGPVAATLQGDFLLKADEDANAPTDRDRQAVYLSLLNTALAQKPDLIVLPETPWLMYLNREFRQIDPQLLTSLSMSQQRFWLSWIRQGREWHDRFRNLARQHQTAFVVGAMSSERQPAGTYPAEHKYNSAFVFYPDGRDMGRYDKINLVLFGEYVPFRYTIKPIYRWLNDNMTPFGRGGYEYSLTPGSDFRVFTLPERMKDGSRTSDFSRPTLVKGGNRFGVTICYEDVIPQVFRRFMLDGDGKKRVDFMLNISNDGWFGHGAQQAQHLVNCAFRAIENRVGIARSVNTGISGFVRPDGSWHHLVAADPTWPKAGGTGYQVARLESSPSITGYARFGDVFGLSVALLGCAAAVDAILARRRERRQLRRMGQRDA